MKLYPYRLLKATWITISMNGAGRSVDNICIERFGSAK